MDAPRVPASSPGGDGRTARTQAEPAASAETRHPKPPATAPAPRDGNRTLSSHDDLPKQRPSSDPPPQPREFTRAGEQGAGERPEESGAPEPAPDDKDPNPRLERIGERTEDFVDSVESAMNKAVPKKVYARRDPRQNTVVNVTWRALVLLAGMSLIGIGIVLLVLPGPGWGSILLGLAILASEYTWANRLMGPVRRRVRAEASRVNRLPSRQQKIVKATVLAASIGGVIFGIWYLVQNGVTTPW